MGSELCFLSAKLVVVGCPIGSTLPGFHFKKPLMNATQSDDFLALALLYFYSHNFGVMWTELMVVVKN